MRFLLVLNGVPVTTLNGCRIKGKHLRGSLGVSGDVWVWPPRYHGVAIHPHRFLTESLQ